MPNGKESWKDGGGRVSQTRLNSQYCIHYYMNPRRGHSVMLNLVMYLVVGQRYHNECKSTLGSNRGATDRVWLNVRLAIGLSTPRNVIPSKL